MIKHSKIILFIIAVFMLAASFAEAQQSNVYTDPALSYKTGIMLFQQEKYGAAQEKFRQAIADFEKQNETSSHLLLLEAFYFDARCSKMLSRPDAEKLFLDLVNNYEENATTRLAYFHLADLYFDQKKYDKAITWYKKVDPADLSAEEKTEYNFQMGFSYFYKKEFEKAKPLLNEVRTLKGGYYYPANYYYGYITYKEGSYKEALASFQEVEKSELYHSIVPYYIANIYFQQKKYDEEINYANGFKSDDKLQYGLEMQQLTGKSYFEKGQYDKAMPYFTAFMSAAPKLNKSDIYQIGFCQYKTKNYAAAINSFKELNVLDDSLGQNALYLMGDCYLKTGEKSNARLAFEQASRMNFDLFVKENASFQFAKLSFELNYHDVSVAALQDFITSFPKSSNVGEAKELLSLEFLSTQNYRDALTLLRTMDAKNPAIRKAYQKVAYSRATELYNAGELNESIATFDESLKNPVDGSLQAAAYFWKGQSFYKQQKYSNAITALSQFADFTDNKTKLPANVSDIHSAYTIGYCYLKQESYANASDYFQRVMKSTAASGDASMKKIYADATLRNGDCGFVLKNYSAAIGNYEEVASEKLQGADYALYQKAVILGLQNKTAEKLSAIRRIITDYPGSIYMDDALYELGTTNLTVPAYQDAATAFSQVIEKYPNSNYVSKAHLKMGLIYFNLDKDDDALREYRWVLNKYPKSPEGAEALNGVKEIYTSQGNAQGYLDFVKGIANINVTDAVKDSVMYQAAENKYSKNDCSGAIKEFSNYLTAFPAGAFASPAHFYRAECLFNQNDFDAALTDYAFVAGQPQSRFTEKSLLNAARISYTQKKDYSSAYNYYKKLRENAEFKANSTEATKGMMYSAYYLSHYNDVVSSAEQLLNAENAKAADLTEAHYYLAKVYDAQQDLTKAFAEYSVVSKEKSAIGAESGYRMAEIYFKQNNLKAAEAQCYALLKQKPVYDYWIAKSYLLIADIFETDGDYFQAKSTLQSVIDNYKGADEIVSTAKEKLKNVTEKEANQSRLKPENQPDEMELDSIPGVGDK
ncbi:MAG: tetratricopeptide repeat protein [Chitinophagaceae bacterium]|nr:tetratricopeptide repeat protein [Chitinophagaceae bacterium]